MARWSDDQVKHFADAARSLKLYRRAELIGDDTQKSLIEDLYQQQHRGFARRLIFRNRVKPSLQKYFALSELRSGLWSPCPAPTEGRIAIVTSVVRDAMDVLAPPDERRERGRQSRVVLIPRRWNQARERFSRAMAANKPGTPGRARSKP